MPIVKNLNSCVQGFLENSHPTVQSLESLQQRAMEEFCKVTSFFGEDGKATTTESFFGIFTEFIAKFEVSCMYVLCLVYEVDSSSGSY